MMTLLQVVFKSIVYASNGQEGLRLFKKSRPDIIITDIQMPDMNGLEMIEQISDIDVEIPIVITTAFNESDYLLQAINLNVDAYVMKPVNIKYLLEKLLKVLEPLELKKELIKKNQELEEINKNLDSIAKEKTKELEYLYSHDTLTGLSNFISLGEEVETHKYEYLLLLDISNFSMINKQYGKDFSNKILQKVAVKLKENLNKQKRLFKTESDRFVILSQEKEHNLIEEFANQIISFFDTQKLLVDEFEININFTIGIAEIVGNVFPLVNAEYALESAKELGSRYYHFYDIDTVGVEKVKENIKWLNVTKKMIEDDEIIPYFQPISDIETGIIVKYEVLARGKYDGKVITPYNFINPAERLGLLSSITRMMINKSFAYFEETDISFSINITQRDILDKHFLSFIETKLIKFKISPSQVTFEILEGITILEQSSLILLHLKALKMKGFKLAIDDFGIENSNFSRLIDIDFDYIKLDGLFIKGLEENKKDRIVVMAIVNMAKTLGIETIAEFVESANICELVRECGVTMAQGYYVGKPLENILENFNAK